MTIATNERLIRPIIMAASRQKNLWPLSTPETPFCLRSINAKSSLMVRLLQALEANPAYASPIIILNENAARLGITEITRSRSDSTIILVPDRVGSGISCLLGAIETAQTGNNTHFAFIPGSFFATDTVEAFRALSSIAPQCSSADHAVVMSARTQIATNTLRIELDSRFQNSAMIGVKRFHANLSGDMLSILNETGSLVQISGPALIATQNFLNHAQQNFATTYVACHNSMKLAEKYGKTYKPQRDFLSFAGKPRVQDYFESTLPNMRTFIGNTDWRTIETFKDSFFDDYKANPVMPVSVAGPAGHKIIASNDGVLILHEGYEESIAHFYPSMPDAADQSQTVIKPKGPTLRFSSL
jgi:mannose-1-phosphate guanylyltransferase